MAQSPATVVMFAAPGRMSDVLLCVKVSAPENSMNLTAPVGAVEPSDVIVVVPEMMIDLDKTEPRSVVVADAIVDCEIVKSWAFARM